MDGDGRQTLPAPDQRRFEAVRELRHLLEWHGPSARGLDHEAAQGLERGTLVGDGARDDIDKVNVVAHLGDGRPRQHGIDGLTQGLRADAERAGTVLIHLDPNHLGRLVPVEVDILSAWRVAKQRREALREFAHFRRVRAADTELERPADRRTKLKRVYPRHHSARTPADRNAARIRFCTAGRTLKPLVTITACAKKSLVSCWSSGR